jgi:hypothetical protein
MNTKWRNLLAQETLYSDSTVIVFVVYDVRQMRDLPLGNCCLANPCMRKGLKSLAYRIIDPSIDKIYLLLLDYIILYKECSKSSRNDALMSRYGRVTARLVSAQRMLF